MDRSYIAFISYKHTKRDAAIAKQVHTLIENYIIPKPLRKHGKKLGVVFRDEEELPIASDLTASICTALDASRYLIVVCSPEARQSPWVAREVEYFLKNHDARDAFVILADGEPNDVFPRGLTHVLDPNTGEYQEIEPLALDVRAGSISSSLRKVRTHIKKLYAGMLGCSYDSLVQREKSRKFKRLTALAALFVLLAGCFTGMLIVKNRELSMKNDELTAAINLALSRESAVLVEQAEESLQSGDVAEALRYATDALYSPEIARPYFAPAERVLFSALDILQEVEDTPLMTKTALKQSTPVEMMAFSPDSSVVYTIDAYGTVNSFSRFAGDLLWCAKLKETESLFATSTDAQLWYDAPSSMVVCAYDDRITGLDAATGQVAWQIEYDQHVCSGFYYDAAAQRLAYIGRYTCIDWDNYADSYDVYSFIAHSTRDGSPVNEIPLLQLSVHDSASFGSYADDQSGGMFTDSGCFVGTLLKTENGQTETLLYSVNLTANTAAFISNPTLKSASDYLRTFDISNSRALVLSRKSDMDLQTGYFVNQLILQCFDLQLGCILWESAIVPEQFVSSYANCYVIPGKKGIVIGAGANMLVVANDSGELLASTELQAEIIALHSLADGLFAFSLADGYCAIGWRSQGDLCDSRLYAATVDLPDSSEVHLLNNGLIQVYFTGNKLDGFSLLTEQEGSGSVVYLSEDRCTTYIASAAPMPELPEALLFQSPNGSTGISGNLLDMTPDGAAMTGPVQMAEGKALNVVDNASHAFTTYRLDETVSALSNSYLLTADRQHIIAWTRNGHIHRISADGTAEPLARAENIVLKVVRDMTFGDDKFQADAARLSSTGQIIAATCDGEQIRFWTDGQEETVLQTPNGIRWAVVQDLARHDLFRIGENGLMVMSDFASEESTELRGFAVYNMESRTWKLIDDIVRGTEDRPMTFGQTSQVFAVFDQDMCIRVYDACSAKLSYSIHTELPLASVVQIGFILDDRYVYVYTKDNQLIIYTVDNGNAVFRTMLSNGYMTSDLITCFDKDNDRLYILKDGKMLCVDVWSWEPLFSGKDVVLYSAAQNELFVYRRDEGSSSYSLKAIPIPTTSELIGIAQKVFH